VEIAYIYRAGNRCEVHKLPSSCLGLGVKRLRIEFYDESGCRHTISLDGAITREKVGRILDYAELMAALPSNAGISSSQYPRTKLERIRDLVLHRLRDSVFSSDQVTALYQDLYGERIPLTTVATYLSRLVDRGLLRRSGSSARWHYCLAEPPLNPQLE